jgi:hypothetical protein
MGTDSSLSRFLLLELVEGVWSRACRSAPETCVVDITKSASEFSSSTSMNSGAAGSVKRKSRLRDNDSANETLAWCMRSQRIDKEDGIDVRTLTLNSRRWKPMLTGGECTL